MLTSLLAACPVGGLHRQYITVPGTDVRMPATLMRGATEGPFVLLTSGVHGSEYPGLLASIEMTHELAPQGLCGTLLFIHPVNVPAFEARVSAVVPEDGKNINRMFPGSATGSVAEKIAACITLFSDAADFYLDLHSGDLYEDLSPYVYFPGNAAPEVVAASREAALCLDLPYMVKSGATTGAYNSAALRGTPALLLERGGAGLCLREDVDAYKKDIRNLLRHLGIMGDPREGQGNIPKELTRVIYLEAEEQCCWVPETKPGQSIRVGQKLGYVIDLFGKPLREFYAEMDAVVLYQLYPLSCNAGDVLVAYGA